MNLDNFSTNDSRDQKFQEAYLEIEKKYFYLFDGKFSKADENKPDRINYHFITMMDQFSKRIGFSEDSYLPNVV